MRGSKAPILIVCLTAMACSSKTSSTTGESRRAPREPVVDTVYIPEGSAAPPRSRERGNPSEGYRECDMEGIGYLDRSKISEALNTLGALVRSAQAAFEAERVPQNILGDGSPEAQFTHDLCKSSTVVPLEVPRGDKFQPGASDFGGDATTGWKCLKLNRPSTSSTATPAARATSGRRAACRTLAPTASRSPRSEISTETVARASSRASAQSIASAES